MAQRIQTLFIDDLDGSEAEGTVRFGLDGASYEIDLNPGHASALRGVLAPYVEVARRAAAETRTKAGRQSGLRTPGSTARALGNGGRVRHGGSGGTNEQREYLRALGHDVKLRGRIPAHLAALPVPPRDTWPAAGGNGTGTILAPELPGPLVRDAAPSADEVAATAVDAILAEPPAEAAKAEPSKTGSYDPEQRAKAVAMTQEPGATIAGTSRALGISEGSLRNWIKAAREAAAK